MGVLLEVDDIAKRYGGIVALDGVSFSLEEGEALGCIGPNGAGKTTLFNVVHGVESPDRGRISFGGRRIDRLPVFERARLGIGRTFQRVELFAGMTVEEHLLVALRARRGDGRLWKDLLNRGAPAAEELRECEEVLGSFGLAELAKAPVESLTLGQGRFLELARALVQRPRLLLLDEPSSGLDSAETASLASSLAGIRDRGEASLLIVEHDLELVGAVARRVLVLDFGRVIAEGTLDAVLAEPAVRRAYLGGAA
jgi:branched-chain amino acid transport system ATP-binding protein